MIEIKQNYFLRNCVDLEVSVKDYLKNADSNFIVFENDEPLVWGDRTPVVYGSMDEAMASVNELKNVGKVEYMTEKEFIFTYCFNAIEILLSVNVLDRGEDDGVCTIVFLNNLNGVIYIDGMTDILNVAIGKEDGAMTFLISDMTDENQTFVSLDDVWKYKDVVFEILMQVLK